jgi:LysR family transcriptional regulator, cyn operon transcriptional activator
MDACLHLVPVFLDLIQSLNVSRTAERLNISQPAVSRQLRALEEILKVSLFVRQSRGLAPTPAGRALAQKLRPTLDALREGLRSTQEDSSEMRGVIMAGCLSEVGQKIFGPLLFEFAAQNPGISVDLRLLSESEIAKQLLDGTLGLGIATKELPGESVRVHKWLRETITVFTSSENKCDLETNLAPKFVCYRTHDSLMQEYLRQFPLKNSKPEILVSVNSHGSMIHALEKLNCYAVMPLHGAASAISEKRIRIASKNHLTNEVMLALPNHDFQERRYIEALKFLKKNVRAIENLESKLLSSAGLKVSSTRSI